MRSIPSLLTTLLVVLLLSPSKLSASDTILVEPGIGTLEDAINQYGGDVIYQLEAGKRYKLEGIINVIPQVLGGAGKTLTIVGEETDGLPAIIQVGSKNDGSLQPQLFNISANLTLKNLFISDQDDSGVAGTNVFNVQAAVKMVIDHCVIDPAGQKRTFMGGDKADHSKLFLTNSQIYRNGHMQGANDGGWLAGMAWDTLWVENNTLVSSGQDFIGTPFHSVPNNQFIWVNHNTFLWHDVWIKKSYTDQNFYFTNNLMHDISLFPELPRWYKFFPDFEHGNNLLCQTAIDTLEINGVPETLPSERVAFWQYNLMYYSPGVQEVPKYAADNDIELAYLIPMVWDEDVPLSYTGGVVIGSWADSCRETNILSDRESWPYMKYDHNWYDIDPLYNDPMIYSINDSVGKHILGFYRGVYWEEPDAPEVADLPSYNWDIDDWNGTEPAAFPVIWPRFDGTYSNTELLDASIEGLPLGDLNWYPDQKFEWYANKEMIEGHILDLKEERYTLMEPDSIMYRVHLSLTDDEGLPVSGALLLVNGDTISWSDADGVIEFHERVGSYELAILADGYLAYNYELALAYASAEMKIVLEKPQYELLFVVVNSSDPLDSIDNASIVIEDRPEALLTDAHGQAGMEANGSVSYKVNKEGFFELSGEILVTQATVLGVELTPDRTGINEFNSGIRIYPNPSRGLLTLELDDYQDAEVKIFNILGTLVKEAKLSTQLTHIDLVGLNQGIYVIKVQKPGLQFTERIILQK